MESTKIVSAVVKLWVWVIIAGGLWFVWKERAIPPLASDIEKADQITHTEVAVRIGTVSQMTLHGTVTGYGSIEPAPATADQPAADAKLTVDWPAMVTQVKCVEGQNVASGDVLFVAEVTHAIPGHVKANNAVTSPISGTVQAVLIHPGEVALPTSPVVEVVDLDRLVISAGIPTWEAALIAPGQSAAVDLPADPSSTTRPSSATFSSTVQRVDPSADPKTNLVSVDIAVPPGHGYRPGELARVTITASEKQNCLVVPADSIVRDSLDRPYIGIVSEDHRQAILKMIEPGLREGDWVEASAPGLEAGQSIVVSGAYGLLFRTDIKVLNP